MRATRYASSVTANTDGGDDDDEMSDEERAEFEGGLDESIDDMRAGKTFDGPEFLARLRAER